MQLCWEHEPNDRPSMSQILQWAESIEFDSLRVDSNLVEVTAISTTCVGRIEPSLEDSHFNYSDRSDTAFELLASQSIDRDSLSASMMSTLSVASESIEASLIQPRTGRDGMGEMYRRVGAMDEAHSLSQDSSIHSSDKSGCTQTWLCGRDKRKGLVTIFTYQDNVPGYSVSSMFHDTVPVLLYNTVDLILDKNEI